MELLFGIGRRLVDRAAVAVTAPTATVLPSPAVTATNAMGASPEITATGTVGGTAGASPSAAVKAGTQTSAALATVRPILERLPPLQREVAEAYLRYWDVRIQAYYTLDGSRLSEVMAGDELARAERRIRDMRSQGKAAKTDVEHNFRIFRATSIEAVAYDEYVNRSVLVDAVTKQEPASTEPPTIEKISYQMRLIDGLWKVVDGEQHV